MVDAFYYCGGGERSRVVEGEEEGLDPSMRQRRGSGSAACRHAVELEDL